MENRTATAPPPSDSGRHRRLLDLTPFVPSYTLRHLAKDPVAPERASALPIMTVAVFADISGFTALTEQLALLGARGAEEVREVLNSCFGPLIDLITQHGGEIEKFAGDATLALWPVEDESGLEDAVRRASQCCLEAIAELDGLDVRTDFRLRLRLAVTAGPAWLARVGGIEGRWETMVIGQAIEQIGGAITRAEPGDVVLSASAWTHLGAWADGRALDQGHRKLERVRQELPIEPTPSVRLGGTARDTLRLFVPVSLQSRLEAGQTGWLAEFRRVTVLFASLGEIPFDDASALEPLQRAIRTFQHSVYRFGGSVNQVMTDDKGTCLIAAWGLAFRTYDDNPVRALRAALSLRRELTELDSRIRIGVATGQAYTGIRGNRRRMEYALIGDAINLAARLMQSASGGAILCDRYTQAPSVEMLDFERLEPVRVKGKKKPIQVFRPLGQRKIRDRRKRQILGREKEKRALRRHLLELAADGASSTVLLEGEAGIGKSHLLDDFLDQARSADIRALQGNGDAIERNRTHYPWRPIFSQLLGFDGVADPEEEERQLFLHLEPEEHALAPLLAPVLPFELEDTEVTSGLTAQGRAEARLDLMVELLRRATAEKPTLILMEDAHWLDSASWSLLEAVHGKVERLLVVIGTRPIRDRDLTSESRRLLEDPDLVMIRLGPLEPDAVLDLVRLRLGAKALPESLSELLLHKAEGHPFFTEELAYSLRDQGLIRVEEGACVLSDEAGSFGSLSFPDTAQGVVTGRIDILDPRQQLTLKVASVLGRRFESTVLAQVHPIKEDRARLEDHLAALSELELIHPVDEIEEQETFRFKHSITQEAAYELLPFAQRRQLHRSVAEWHEEHSGEELGSVFGLLAHHWSQAEVPTKALHYLEQAGLQAERSYAYREVARSFTKALQLDESHGEDAALDNTIIELSPRRRISARIARRARWRRLLGNAKATLGRLDEGAVDLEACLRLLGEHVPETRGEWIRGLLYQVMRQARHRLRPNRVYQHTGEAAECLLEAAKAFSRLGAYHYVGTRRLEFMWSMLSGLNVAEHVPPSAELAASYSDVCNVAGLIPVHFLARDYVKLALETAEPVDEMATWARVLSRTGIYLTVVGDWSVLPNLERSLDLAERLGDPYQWEESTFLLGMAKLYRGRFEAAAACGRDVVDRARRSGIVVHEIWAWGLMADCALHMGQLAEAIELAERLAETIEASAGQHKDNVIRGLGIRAVAHQRLGQRDRALEAMRAVRAEIDAGGRNTHIALQGYVGLADVLISYSEEGSDRSLLAEARSACKSLDKFVRMMPVANARYWLLRSRLSRLEGKDRAAEQWLARSLFTARQTNLSYDEARSLAVQGRAKGADSEDGRRDLLAAAEIFRQCGCAWDLERTNEALSEGRNA